MKVYSIFQNLVINKSISTGFQLLLLHHLKQKEFVCVEVNYEKSYLVPHFDQIVILPFLENLRFMPQNFVNVYF